MHQSKSNRLRQKDYSEKVRKISLFLKRNTSINKSFEVCPTLMKIDREIKPNEALAHGLISRGNPNCKFCHGTYIVGKPY